MLEPAAIKVVVIAGDGEPEAEDASVSQHTDRLDVVRRYTSLARDDDAFGRVARMAAKAFATPMASVSVVDQNRVWFLATEGLEGITETVDVYGLCASVVLGTDPYIVTD